MRLIVCICFYMSSMSASLTPASAKSREAFVRNVVKRGHSNDSQETQDSPFGSSLATPLDPNDVSIKGASASASSALRFLIGAGDSPFVDYFGLKRNNSLILSSASESNLSPEYTNTGTSRVCSTAGTPAEDTLFRKKSIYNLPNSPIDVGARYLGRSTSETSVFSSMDDIPRASVSEDSGAHIPIVEDSLATEDYTLDDFSFTDEDPLWFFHAENLSSVDITALITRVVCFIPWCICVGGAMLLWPDKLETIAFEAGYMNSTKGIRRFAHWADVGHQFVMTFLGFLALALWALPPMLGVTLSIGLVTRFAYVWRGFRIDYSVPLGNDDRQSLYLLTTVGRHLMDKSVTLTKTEAGFLLAF